MAMASSMVCESVGSYLAKQDQRNERKEFEYEESKNLIMIGATLNHMEKEMQLMGAQIEYYKALIKKVNSDSNIPE